MKEKVSGNSLPNQKVPLSQKTREWKESCVNYYVAKERPYSYFTNVKINYDLYNGIYDEKDIQYVVNPFKVKDGFPASPHNFNIIKPKIDLLLGELTKRPDTLKVYHTSEDAISKIQEEKVQALKDYIATKLGDGFDDMEDDQKLQEIQEYFTNSYVEEAEEVAYHTINYLKEKLKLENETYKGFKDGLISGIEVYYKGIINGEPYSERVNPYYLSFDRDPNLKDIEKGEYVIYRMVMNLPAIHQRFGDLMTDSEFNILVDSVYQGGTGNLRTNITDVGQNSVQWRNAPNWFAGRTAIPENNFVVWHVQWASFKKIGFLEVPQEDGTTITITVDENYKAGPDEVIEWEWWKEIWEGYKIEDKLIIGVRPIEDQDFSLENPQENSLSYIGSLYNNTNTINKSLVETMKALQYMYIIVWYRLELALARDKGKAFVMDITQIPKNMGLDIPQWLHYLTSLGIAFVNPYEEGWDIPGREGGKPASMNQFAGVDLSMQNVIEGYIGLLAKIEDMVGELSGVSKQRQGQVSSRELVGSVERAVTQMSHITEHLFWVHNDIKKRLYNALLSTAQTAWSRTGKQKLYYIMDDGNRAFLDINDQFYYSPFGVFITDSTKENINLEKMSTLLQPAMQNGATLLDVATILTSNSMVVIKNKLREIEGRREKMMQQQVEAEQAAAQRQDEIKQEELRLKEEDSIRKAETSITVAQIQAESKAEGTEAPEAEEPEDRSLDIAKLNFEREKFVREISLKNAQQRETERANKKAEEFKTQEIAIKRKVANKPRSTSSK